jgi:hypothetical protein
MKQLILLTGLFIFIACGSNKDDTSLTASETTVDKKDSAAINYPMPTLYSPSWEAGDHKHVVTVMNIGKEWTENNFESFDKGFADSVSAYFASGDRWIGTRDSVVGLMKDFRMMYSDVKAEIHSVVPLRHRDTKEDWVCIWLKEITTTAQGKKDSIELQESWRLNSEGKVNLIYQYAATIKPVKK